MPLALPYCFLVTMVVMAAEYAGNWKAPKAPEKAPVMNRCQICRLPVEYNSSTTMVDVTEARSLSIITNLRFQRSTNAPAKGVTISAGTKVKNPTKARAVACWVISQAQIVSAKPVIAVPCSDTTWPIQMMVKPSMPVGRVARLMLSCVVGRFVAFVLPFHQTHLHSHLMLWSGIGAYACIV